MTMTMVMVMLMLKFDVDVEDADDDAQGNVWVVSIVQVTKLLVRAVKSIVMRVMTTVMCLSMLLLMMMVVLMIIIMLASDNHGVDNHAGSDEDDGAIAARNHCHRCSGCDEEGL